MTAILACRSCVVWMALAFLRTGHGYFVADLVPPSGCSPSVALCREPGACPFLTESMMSPPPPCRLPSYLHGLHSYVPHNSNAARRSLIRGATGVAGKLAVQIAKYLGAGRVVAAGRNEQILKTLNGLGADATIHLDRDDKELAEAFTREAS